MLLRVEIENFYSIRDRQVLDFRLPRTTPESARYGRCNLTNPDRAPHVIAIFGANASGKTNFLRAVAFMQRFAVESFDDYKPEEPLLLLPFNRSDSRQGISRLAMEFVPSVWMTKTYLKEEFGKVLPKLFRYELEIDHSGGQSVVHRESLKWSEGGRGFSSLFDRKIVDDKYQIKSHRTFELKASDPRKSVRRNVSLISSLLQFEHKPSMQIAAILKHGFFSNISTQKHLPSVDIVTDFLDKSEPVLKALNKKIRIIDLGIERIDIVERGDRKIPVFSHAGLDGVQTYPFESAGTQSFYLNFIDLFLALGSGGVATMDELDADLHPNLMSEIIRWFQDPSENWCGAQLIMSCHNASLIAELEKEEVVLASKNDAGETTLTPLANFKGLRRDANLYTKYLSGEFGGTPRFG